MTLANTDVPDAIEIRTLIDDRVKAVRSKNVDASVAKLAPDILSFDVIGPLQRSGSNASGERAEEWFSSFRGPIEYDIHNLNISAADGVAFAFGLSHVSATTTNGDQLDMWWRSTLCLRKIDGKWLVTHEHNSVPFETKTGKASLNLRP